ncbi:MAG: methyltransferase domain-containing protein, partial [Planctomycetota bacterium]
MPVPPPRWQDQVILQHIPSNSSVLDLGCGSGDLLHALRQKNIHGQGVELSHDAVQTC